MSSWPYVTSTHDLASHVMPQHPNGGARVRPCTVTRTNSSRVLRTTKMARWAINGRQDDYVALMLEQARILCFLI